MKKLFSRIISILLFCAAMFSILCNATMTIAQGKELTSNNWKQIFEIVSINEYVYSESIGDSYVWADGKIKNLSSIDFSKIVLIMDVDFGDKKRTFEGKVHNLEAGKTSAFYLSLTKKQQKEIRRNQIPVVEIKEVKYYADEYNKNSAENQLAPSDSNYLESISSKIALDFANKFSKDFGSGYGKKLEDAYKENKDDVELAAMYHYYNALFLSYINDKGQAKIEMREIDPNYSGIMADEIIEYGIILFGSIEEWTSQSNRSEIVSKTLTTKQKNEIKRWIEERYSYYDKIAGGFSGEKYTKTIFKEASDKFELTVDEVMNIWTGVKQ